MRSGRLVATGQRPQLQTGRSELELSVRVVYLRWPGIGRRRYMNGRPVVDPHDMEYSTHGLACTELGSVVNQKTR